MGIEKLLANLLGIEDGKPETLGKESYAYVEINFEDANYQGNNIKLTLPGKSCTKVEYSGNKQDATLKIGNKRADELPLSKIKSLKSIGGFDEIFLSSSDTHGKLVLVVSEGVISEIKPTLEDEVSQSRRAMKTDVLVVSTSGASDTLQCPTGKRLEILGFNAIISQGAPTGVGSDILLYSIDEDDNYQALFRFMPAGDGIGNNSVHVIAMPDLMFRSGLNKGVGLSNMQWAAGTPVKVAVTIYYREV